MINLLEYEEWNESEQQKDIGQLISVKGEIGQILSFDSVEGVWLVRFSDKVRKIKLKDMKDVKAEPGSPFGKLMTQIGSPTLAI